jgi:hypothetical protein
MELMCITIPDVPAFVPSKPENRVISAIREAGLCPRKAAGNAMVVALAKDWIHGTGTRATFINGCRNMAIFNPSLML